MPDTRAGASSARRMVDNASISAACHFGSTILLLALTPVIVASLGIDAYGLWSLLQTLVRYSLFADFGLGPSVTTHVAQAYARNDVRTIRKTVTIATAVYCTVGVVLVLAALAVAPYVLTFIKMPASLHAIAPHLLVASLGAFVLNLSAWVPISSTLAGLGRLRVSAMCNALGTLSFIAVAIFVLHAHLGLPGLIGATFVQVSCSSIAGYIVARRVIGPIYLSPFSLDRATVRSVMTFGGWVQLGTLANLINVETPSVILGLFAGVQYVALFDIGSRLGKVIKAFSFHFNAALLPTVSTLEVTDGAGGSSSTLAGANRIFALISFGISGFVVAASPEIIHFWLGSTVKREDLVLLVVLAMSIVYVVEGLTAVVSTGLFGTGKPRLGAIFSVAYATVDLATSLLLTPRLGLRGVLIALVVGSVVGNAIFTVATARAGVAKLSALAGYWLLGLASSTVCASAIAWYLSGHLARLLPRERLVSFAEMFVTGPLYLVLLVVALWLFHFFTESDLQRIKKVVPIRFSKFFDSRLAKRLFYAS